MELRGIPGEPRGGAPPARLAAPLSALWHDGHGDWKRAHEIVQAERSKAAERVHAYLHRKEGRSCRTPTTGTTGQAPSGRAAALGAEWEEWWPRS